MYVCMNCGFKFVNPGHKQVEVATGGLLCIDARALDVICCPKCRSDAIKEAER